MITNNIILLINIDCNFPCWLACARATPSNAGTTNHKHCPSLNLKFLKLIRKHRPASIRPMLVVSKKIPVLQDGIHCIMLITFISWWRTRSHLPTARTEANGTILRITVCSFSMQKVIPSTQSFRSIECGPETL